ncbi:ExeA family protein [Denitromonas iodatirespirans]|uniref:AAA family ATPase n=1 Tax=Denitromonas iodatirespirans TaxID=2795389 RepID=A0A944DQB5_DENI1|nr:AAA family ATPase [Denitromonas iodatirespirans]MBT0962674.1 AAA family ATPase [Denitromonas iodatirespirans]
MYLDHYGLREAPFRLTPLTDFFFSGAQRGATVDALIYAVLHDEGIVKVSGEVGAGKTMLCRVLIERLPATVDSVYLANPCLAPDDLLQAVAAELGLSVTHERAGAILGAIQDDLIRRHGAGRRVVVLIDEAHAMPPASLEQIRLLSNLETGRHKLLQLVLFGQPELDTLLAGRDMRQLKDRITHHFRLSPLTPDEVAAYLEFRMHAAGYRGPAVFSPAATRHIARIAEGLSRRINVLADKALLAAYSQNRHVIAPAHVTAAARDAEYQKPRPRHRLWPLIAAAAAGAAAAVVIPRWLDEAAPDAPTIAAAPAAPLDAPTAPEAPATAPEAPATAPEAPAAAAAAADTPPAPPPQVAQAAPPAPPTAAQPRRAATPSPPQPPATTTLTETPADTPAALATVGEQPAPATVVAAATSSANASATPGSAFGPLALDALAAQRTWMAATPDSHWFIQLHTNTDLDYTDLERQIDAAHRALPAETIRIYSTRLGDRHRVGVIIGSYASEQDALDALGTLPPGYRKNAYIRQVARLR